tara:strand:+ start:257 stop:718 length:462 start_codon:yes stop_codon:yes gene_type:complete
MQDTKDIKNKEREKLARYILRQGWRSGLNQWFVLDREMVKLICASLPRPGATLHAQQTAPNAFKIWPRAEWLEEGQRRDRLKMTLSASKARSLARSQYFAHVVNTLEKKMSAKGWTRLRCEELARAAREGDPRFTGLTAKLFPQGKDTVRAKL